VLGQALDEVGGGVLDPDNNAGGTDGAGSNEAATLTGLFGWSAGRRDRHN